MIKHWKPVSISMEKLERPRSSWRNSSSKGQMTNFQARKNDNTGRQNFFFSSYARKWARKDESNQDLSPFLEVIWSIALSFLLLFPLKEMDFYFGCDCCAVVFFKFRNGYRCSKLLDWTLQVVVSQWNDLPGICSESFSQVKLQASKPQFRFAATKDFVNGTFCLSYKE